MEHLAVKAAVSEVTDLGEFEALAATWAVDRVKDQIIPGAFEKTIAAWQASGKMLPVHWAHSGEAKDIIGVVDPASMRETAEGLYVRGKLDLNDSGVAREVWRSMKNNAVALSFGYLTKAQERRAGGINALLEIDLFEVTIASGPINPETRFLSLKAATAERELAALRRRSDELAIEVALGAPLHEFLARRRAETRDIPSHAELRRKSDDLAIEVALGQPLAELRKQVTETETESIPTDAELRAKCRELGFAVPTPRRRKAPPYDLEAVRAEARDTIIAQLRGV